MRAVVPALQAKLSRLGGNDGRAWVAAGAHHDHALGAPLRTGVREALEPLCPAGWGVMADGRDHLVHFDAMPDAISFAMISPSRFEVQGYQAVPLPTTLHALRSRDVELLGCKCPFRKKLSQMNRLVGGGWSH
jgi:hypothetical protein